MSQYYDNLALPNNSNLCFWNVAVRVLFMMKELIEDIEQNQPNKTTLLNLYKILSLRTDSLVKDRQKSNINYSLIRDVLKDVHKEADLYIVLSHVLERKYNKKEYTNGDVSDAFNQHLWPYLDNNEPYGALYNKYFKLNLKTTFVCKCGWSHEEDRNPIVYGVMYMCLLHMISDGNQDISIHNIFEEMVRVSNTEQEVICGICSQKVNIFRFISEL